MIIKTVKDKDELDIPEIQIDYETFIKFHGYEAYKSLEKNGYFATKFAIYTKSKERK